MGEVIHVDFGSSDPNREMSKAQPENGKLLKFPDPNESPDELEVNGAKIKAMLFKFWFRTFMAARNYEALLAESTESQAIISALTPKEICAIAKESDETKWSERPAYYQAIFKKLKSIE